MPYTPGLYKCKKCGSVFEIQKADIERRPELIGCAPCGTEKKPNKIERVKQ